MTTITFLSHPACGLGPDGPQLTLESEDGAYLSDEGEHGRWRGMRQITVVGPLVATPEYVAALEKHLNAAFDIMSVFTLEPAADDDEKNRQITERGFTGICARRRGS